MVWVTDWTQACVLAACAVAMAGVVWLHRKNGWWSD